ncbi:hypothetical protein GMSM_41120 [Geomonas sp. Red276]
MSDLDKEYDGIRYKAKDTPPLIFKAIFTVLVIWGLCFMGYYLFSGWSSEGEFAAIKRAKEARLAAEKSKGGQAALPTNEERRSTDLMAVGKKEFAERCISCHGPDGKGGIGPDLTKKTYKYGRTAPEVMQTLVEGRPGGMPAFGSELSKDKLEGLVEYVLSL